MFNKTPFTRTSFTRASTENQSFYATVTSEFAITLSPVKILALLDTLNISSSLGMEVATLGMMMPIESTIVSSEFDVEGQLYAKVPIETVSMGAEYDFDANAIRTEENEEMVLSGLNLAPGQTLIIDTDTLEIEVDNEIRVDCWVTGGTFFQLKAGENILTFTDNAENRKLRVTVLWADRYL